MTVAEGSPDPACIPLMTTLSPTELDHRRIPIGAIEISKTNPRKHFDEAKLAELTESVIRYGVLQPILVRPMWRDGDGNIKTFELVAGERRFRATRNAGFEDIPAVVRELDDKQALEVQVIENLQRADLEPLEEAEGYATLIRQHGYDADTLAEKIGKSRSYVYSRIKLIELCAPAKKALEQGVISHSTALLIARIPDQKLQTAATQTIVGNQSMRDPMSFRAAKEFIERNYMLRLAEASFQKDDATLVPKAGPCTTCVFRTGNSTELFGDIKSADVCTKPPCYEAKQDAQWQRLSSEAKERGLRVLPSSEAERVFGHYGNGVDYSAPYVELDKPISYDSKRTYRKALASKLPEVTIARHPRSGEVHELIPRKAAEDALRAAGLLKGRARAADRDSYSENQKAEAKKRKLERAIEAAIVDEIRPKLGTLKLSTQLLRIFTKGLCLSSWRMGEVFKRRNMKPPTWKDKHRGIVAFVDELSDAEMVMVAAELQLDFSNLEQRSGEEKQLVRELAALVGVDAAAIEKRLRADAAAKSSPKPAAKGKKATAKAAVVPKPKAKKATARGKRA